MHLGIHFIYEHVYSSSCFYEHVYSTTCIQEHNWMLLYISIYKTVAYVWTKDIQAYALVYTR